jgi:hypothetical protein
VTLEVPENMVVNIHDKGKPVAEPIKRGLGAWNSFQCERIFTIDAKSADPMVSI